MMAKAAVCRCGEWRKGQVGRQKTKGKTQGQRGKSRAKEENTGPKGKTQGPKEKYRAKGEEKGEALLKVDKG